MAYFQYLLNTHLKRPSTIVTNITYDGSTCPVEANFTGQSMHDNYFNLAKAVIDDTTRLTTLEGYAQALDSENVGYLRYSGRQEIEGYLYSGNPLSFSGITKTFPYSLDSSNVHAMRIAVGDGITYSTEGSINTTTSKFRLFTFGEVAGGPYTTSALLATYLNTKLSWNTKSGANSFSVLGDTSPAGQSGAWWAARFGGLSASNPRSFYLYLNESTVGIKVTFATTITQTLTNLQNAVQNALDTAAGVGAFTVSQSINNILITGNINRNSNGIFQFKMEIDGSESGESILTWLGVLPGSATYVEAYNYSSVLEFVASANTITLRSALTGATPYYRVAFRDNDESASLVPMISTMGWSITNLTTYYHTLHPLATYSKTLNIGGDFWARDGYVRNLTVSGSLTYSGSSSFSGTSTFQNIVQSASYTTSLQATTATTLGLSGALTGTSAVLTGDTTFGTNSANNLVVNSSSTFNNSVSIALGNLTIQSISLVGSTGIITANAINATTGSYSSISVTSLQVGSLSILSNLSVASLTSLGTVSVQGGLTVIGTSRTAGYFYAGTTNPSTSAGSRINYDGAMWSYSFYGTNLLGGATTLSVDAAGQVIRTPSDSKLKENILPITYGLETINSLRPVTHYWKDKKAMGSTRSLGLIAQEVKNIIPEVVSGNEDANYLSVNYPLIIPALIKAIQELSSELDSIKAQLN